MIARYSLLSALLMLTLAACGEEASETSERGPHESSPCGRLEGKVLEKVRADFDDSKPAAIQEQLEAVAQQMAAEPKLQEHVNCLMRASAAELLRNGQPSGRNQEQSRE